MLLKNVSEFWIAQMTMSIHHSILDSAFASAGDHEAFANDLERMDELGEKEASALLHKASQSLDVSKSGFETRRKGLL